MTQDALSATAATPAREASAEAKAAKAAASAHVRTAGTEQHAAKQRAKVKALPLNSFGDNGDFLSRLDEAEKRDTERQMSTRSSRSVANSPAASQRSSSPTPPAVAPLNVQTIRTMAAAAAAGEASLTERSLRTASARTARSTPRPSPHPTPTPRAPRAARTPKTGEDRLLPPQAIGFTVSGTPRASPRISARGLHAASVIAEAATVGLSARGE